MKRNIQIIIVFVLIGCLSCEKKKYPESSVENEAVFYVQGTADYNPLKYVAGENDYYMYSSYALDSNSIYSFAGEFKKLNCTDCRNTLEIRIRDLKASPGGFPNPTDSSLKTGPYRFISGAGDMVHKVWFRGTHNRNVPTNMRWDFGDGTSSTELNPDHTYLKSGKYQVCLTIDDEDGCHGAVCNEINLTENSCVVSVNSTPPVDKTIQFSTTTFGPAPVKYLWNFGDGFMGGGSSPTHTYKYDGSYPVVLTVTDANGQKVVSNYHIVTKKDSYSCVPNIGITGINSSNQVYTAGVVLKWTDGNGVTFTTAKTGQPANSYFFIDKVEDFSPNENMQKTKKLHVRYSCVMSDGRRAIPFTNAQAVICVAVP